ncbi:lipopolysaccharide heptosyltransferase 1, partial [Escherichia coli]|nr:lipopolysaccharide heptosyltransferase 1 [Escherichia coli]
TCCAPPDPFLTRGYGKNQMVCRAPRENLINLNSQAVLEKLSSL